MRRVVVHIACSLALLGAAGSLLAQGKIKLKRPGSEDTAAPAETPAAPASPEKITLTKPGAEAAPAAAPAEDYTTSRGPEAKLRTLYLGFFGGFNASSSAKGIKYADSVTYKSSDAESGLNAWIFSPTLGVRSELYIKRVYGIVLDLGYEQNRTYMLDTIPATSSGITTQSTGYLRTDYFLMRAMFSYRYSLYKVLGKIKFMRPVAEFAKPVAGNLQIGFFGKTPLSAQLELMSLTVGDPNDPYYDVKEYTKAVSGGLMAGFGFEIRLGSSIFFFEGQYFRGLLNAYSSIRSRYFNSDGFAEHGIYFSSGFKTGIYGF